MDETRQVSVEINTKLKNPADPFKVLGEQASSAQKLVTERLDKIQKKLEEAGSFKGIAKEAVIDYFGISKADKQLDKFSANIHSRLDGLRKQMDRIKVGADTAPFEKAMVKLQADAGKVQGVVKKLTEQSKAGFERSADGAMQLSRGLTLIANEDKGIEKMVMQLGKLQAVIDLMKGGRDVIVGVVGGLINLGKATQAMETAGGLRRGVASLTEKLGGVAGGAQVAGAGASALATGGAAGVTALATKQNVSLATSATQAAIAEGKTLPDGLRAAGIQLASYTAQVQAAAAANGELAASGAAASVANAGGPGGAGRIKDFFFKNNATGTGFGGAIGRGLIGSAIGSGIGGLVGGQTGATWGGVIGGVGSMAAPMLGKGLGAVGLGGVGKGAAALASLAALPTAIAALSAGVVAFAAAAKNEKAAGWMAKATSGIPLLNSFFGTKKLQGMKTVDQIRKSIEYEDNPEANPKLSDEDRNNLANQRIERMLRRQKAIRTAHRFGFQDPVREQQYLEEAAIRNPAEERQRNLANTRERIQHSLELDRQQNQRRRKERELEKQQEGFDEAKRLAQRPDAGPDAMQRLAEQGRKLAGAEVAGPKGTAETERAVAEASKEREQALRRVDDLQKKINAANKDDSELGEKKLDLARQLGEAQQELLDADQKRIGAIRQQNAAEVQRLDNLRKWAAEQERFAKLTAEHERDRLKSMQEQFGLMDPLKRKAALDIAKKLQKGQDLTGEELEIAKSVDVLQDPLRKAARKKAEDTPEFGEIVKITGQDQKLKDAEAAAKQFENLKVQLEQKVEAQIRINEQSLAQEVQQKVVPVIAQAIAQVTDQLRQEMTKLLMERNLHDRAGATG